MSPVIIARNLHYKYEDGTVALAGVDFDLFPGETVAVFGGNGSGKTTFVLHLNGLLEGQGTIEVCGLPVRGETLKQVRQKIGIVFQDFRLLDHLTTWENVALPLRVVGKRLADYREDVTDLLQWVGLGDRMHAYPSILSGGEKQRAAIARAVIGKPELLLADEPTGNVDPQMARRLLRLFIELNRLGTSVLIATHDHQLMRQFKAPRLELHDGHVRIV